MTTIAFANATVAPRRTTRLRLTVRGRRALATIAAFPAVVALALAVIGGSSALASGDQGAPAGTFQTVTVMAGDSLWTIAQEVAPQADPREVVSAIQRLNALPSAGLTAGQRVSVPTEYTQGH
ncbi:LysM peptidoglycan-binding domain-containing protein [Microbacterium sp. CJ88]|uniref:LysM peptidoglycan-binding domain-containing protein n=1 Tax=Microbacterium sp. CJ88 TaxID=3445672 RepID=UPI003F658947